MLKIELSSEEKWDEKNECFIPPLPTCTIQLEHSLISISKWEQKWHKSYLGTKEKTVEENLHYIECMITSKNFDPICLSMLSENNITEISEYINDSMTATVLPKQKKGSSNEVITSELIYYYMITFNIPVEFQKWHLNRLITLIKVCELKSQPGKKMSMQEIVSRNAQLNEARRKQLGSSG